MGDLHEPPIDKEGTVSWDWKPNTQQLNWFAFRFLPPPEHVVFGCALDCRWRQEEGIEHPFPKQRSGMWSGCYLIFDVWQWNAPRLWDILPLYVGKAENLQTRLSQHWGGTAYAPWLDYWNDMFEGKYSRSWANHRLDPDGQPWIAVWLRPDGQDRTSLEHELIAQLRPHYNSA